MKIDVDRERLVATATQLVNVHSFTGDEARLADLMVELCDDLGLQVQRQQVEDNRANALGRYQLHQIWIRIGCNARQDGCSKGIAALLPLADCRK